jgi:hypothetical protein
MTESSGKPQISREIQQIRNPWLGLLFGFLMPGWGQLYNGRTRRGLALFGIVFFIVVMVLTITFVVFPLYGMDLFFLTKVLLLVPLVWIFGMYDAFTSAQKINRGDLEFAGKSGLFWFPLLIFILIVGLVTMRSFYFW